MGYTTWTVTALEVPNATKWNLLGLNDASFNDGTGIADGVITPDKLGLGAVRSRINTAESRSSTSYGALSTAQSVTAIIGANGLALVSLSSFFSASNSSELSYFSFVVSGANTIAVSDNNAIILKASSTGTMGLIGKTILLTGLSEGSTTFTVQVKNTVGTSTYAAREITVVPL